MKDNVSFAEDLETLINFYSMECGSDTPDFILADYIRECLGAFNRATRQRDQWYSLYADKPIKEEIEE